MLQNKIKYKVKKHHATLSRNLQKIDNKTLFADDIILTYILIKCDLFQIRPTQSLVRNIGMDGSGVNCSIDPTISSKKINHKTINHKTIILGELPEYSLQFDSEIYRFFYPVLNLHDRVIKLYNKIIRRLIMVFNND